MCSHRETSLLPHRTCQDFEIIFHLSKVKENSEISGSCHIVMPPAWAKGGFVSKVLRRFDLYGSSSFQQKLSSGRRKQESRNLPVFNRHLKISPTVLGNLAALDSASPAVLLSIHQRFYAGQHNPASQRWVASGYGRVRRDLPPRVRGHLAVQAGCSRSIAGHGERVPPAEPCCAQRGWMVGRGGASHPALTLLSSFAARRD